MAEQTRRLASLDAFRGLTIALMILVNMPGSWSHVYAPLEHAEWFGWTPTDLVFPFFLFIMGVSMTYSFAKRKAPESKAGALYGHVVKRGALIILIGLLLNLYPRFEFSSVRVTGVLQRIGLTFILAAPIVMKTRWRAQLALLFGLLLGYWALLHLVPVPSHGPGVLTPEGNLVAWIDQSLLGAHAYSHSPTDPEGLLSTLPSLATVLTGVLTGHYLRSERSRAAILRGLIVAGLLLLAAGWAWSPWFPISKKLWTSSYVLFSSGAALIVLAICYGLIDVRGYTTWAQPALIFGANALAAYVLHILAIRTLFLVIKFRSGTTTITGYEWIYSNLFASWAGAWPGSLLFAIASVLFFLAIMTLLHRRKIFIKL